VATRPQTGALRGSLDDLVLKTLSLVPMRGSGIDARVEQTSADVFEVNPGSSGRAPACFSAKST
jgi:DNA-binding PadR family transcriptional regulator